ncbi:MAG: ABC transporter substrate-binding protein, partial [Actinobacteria bacterium]|nr:ABC transporter substrate-binding protein [Actinomycetota bacterium]
MKPHSSSPVESLGSLIRWCPPWFPLSQGRRGEGFVCVGMGLTSLARCSRDTPSIFRSLGRVPAMTKTSKILALCALVSLAVAGCSSSSSDSNATATPALTGTVRIGVEAPISGDQADTGKGMINGAQLAADQLNAKGGINGKKVVIVPIDDAADAVVGVKAATAAIKKGLDGVVGPYNSGAGAKTLPLYIKAGLTPIRLTSNSTTTNGLGYTLQPMDYQIVPVA